jgi:pyruvate dehydrogenase E1 component beta subunit
LDDSLLFGSVKKTGRLVVADGEWKTGGVSAEISAKMAESEVFKALEAPVVRVSLPDTPAPAGSALEKVYYPRPESLVSAVRKVLEM